MSSRQSTSQTDPIPMSVAMSKILEIFPDALFDEKFGEVIISTGTKLKNFQLVPIGDDNND